MSKFEKRQAKAYKRAGWKIRGLRYELARWRFKRVGLYLTPVIGWLLVPRASRHIDELRRRLDEAQRVRFDYEGRQSSDEAR